MTAAPLPPLPRRRIGRGLSFLAFLDVVFASIGVFVALIVIQSLIVRTEDPVAEPDILAALAGETVLALAADTAEWGELARPGQIERFPADDFIDWAGALSRQANRVLNVEIFFALADAQPREALKARMEAVARAGIGAGRTPPFVTVWRPMLAGEDAAALLRQTAGLDDGDRRDAPQP
ncbi:MAG: hypothetical protein D6754_04300 [Alphaproteobacteria bacterium]|nr:MAG: hypothetical protein D6754_04300 [Alphaproteobacteria bacterium]